MMPETGNEKNAIVQRGNFAECKMSKVAHSGISLQRSDISAVRA
jgi:hypothetical protein